MVALPYPVVQGWFCCLCQEGNMKMSFHIVMTKKVPTKQKQLNEEE